MGIILPDFILAQNEFEDFDAFVGIIRDIYEHQNDKEDSNIISIPKYVLLRNRIL